MSSTERRDDDPKALLALKTYVNSKIYEHEKLRGYVIWMFLGGLAVTLIGGWFVWAAWNQIPLFTIGNTRFLFDPITNILAGGFLIFCGILSLAVGLHTAVKSPSELRKLKEKLARIDEDLKQLNKT